MGYPNTTGLSAIDYFITSSVEHPLGERSYHTEELLRMPNHSACIAEPQYPQTAGDLPAITNGYVTFGSLHRPDKISDITLDLWASVLRAMPDSKLILFNTRFTEASSQKTIEGLANRQIESERVRILSSTDASHYLDTYREIDIALDTTPWAGGTTTIEALWMGIPVVAFSGDRSSARSTAAIVKAVLNERYVANSLESYAEAVRELAEDLGSLSDLRKQLRARLKQTILDGAKFTAELEDQFRNVWKKWCLG
jgi:predicted O-linked N-acetylglucosamine transferase (SPINDLY family)